jgi:membrane protein DedA with SNARE-associated domain
MAHGKRNNGERGGLGFSGETAAGLGDDEHVPAVCAKPARLGEDAKLLAAEADGGFGVHDERSASRHGCGSIHWHLRGAGLLVADLIERFTYLGIFLVLFVAGLGVPIPEEAPLLAAGVLAGQQIIRWWLGLIVCFVGVLAGDIVLYWVGHHWGEHIMDWRITRIVLTPEREKRMIQLYHRHGVKIIFSARFVAGFRAAAFLTAGIVGINFWKFLAVDGLAALIGVPLGFGVAYLFTDQLPAIMHGVHRVERLAVLAGMVALAAVIGYLAYRRSQSS